MTWLRTRRHGHSKLRASVMYRCSHSHTISASVVGLCAAMSLVWPGWGKQSTENPSGQDMEGREQISASWPLDLVQMLPW